MLNENTGYLLGAVAIIIVLPIYCIKTRKQNCIIGRCILLFLLITSITLYITRILFPIPIMKVVIDSGLHEKSNYLVPFSHISTIYKDMVLLGDVPLRKFVLFYSNTVLAIVFRVFPIGLLVKVLFKWKFKTYLLFSFSMILVTEAMKILCNWITTVNYISIIFENWIYVLTSLLLSYLVYLLMLTLCKGLHRRSNILNYLYLLIK